MTATIVKITLIVPEIITLAAKFCLILVSSFVPKRCAVNTDKPAVNPIASPKIKPLILPVAPTAAKASTPMVLLTINFLR